MDETERAEDSEVEPVNEKDQLPDLSEQLKRQHNTAIEEPIPARLSDLILRIKELKDR